MGIQVNRIGGNVFPWGFGPQVDPDDFALFLDGLPSDARTGTNHGVIVLSLENHRENG